MVNQSNFQRILFFAFFFLIVQSGIIKTFAQEAKLSYVEEEKMVKEKPSPGINFHLQLSHLDLSPIFIFPLTEKIHLGGGINYLYYYRRGHERSGTSSYGLNLFSRYYITKHIFAHAEYLYFNTAYRNNLTFNYHRINVA